MVLPPRYRPSVTTKQSKILFLDIDGVVSSHRNLLIGEEFDVVALKMLEILQREIGFLIVISSTRRKHIKSIADFSKMLSDKYGVCLKFHETWRTATRFKQPDLSKLPAAHARIFKQYVRRFGENAPKKLEDTFTWRGFEIHDWLLNRPEKEIKYLIVDDSMDMFPIDIKHLLRIKYGEELGGLQLKHYDQILEYFK